MNNFYFHKAMIRNLINQKVRWSSNYVAFNVSKCSYSNPVSLSQRNLDFDLEIADEEISKRTTTETRPIDFASLVDKMKRIGCSEMNSLDFVKKQKVVSKADFQKFSLNLDLLSKKGIKLRTILDNPWLLNLKHGNFSLLRAAAVNNTIFFLERLRLSLSIIEDMEPRCLDDLIPFAKIQPMDMIKFQQKLLRDKAKVPEESRVYYLSRLLGVEPVAVADCFVRYPRMFWTKIESMEEVIKVLEEFNIKSEDIIRSAYILFRDTKFIREKLTKCRELGLNDLEPKFVQISEEQLKAKVRTNNENMELKPVPELLSERLECQLDFMSSLLKSHKSILKQKPTKVRAQQFHYLYAQLKFSL